MKQIISFVITAFFMCSAGNSFGQCKSFYLGQNGDTLNCIDVKGLKQGKWIEKTPPKYGNPGFEAEGEYKNGLKEGIWRSFTQQGDPLAVQSYRWGLLDGPSAFYNFYGLEREENWYAIDPLKKYDTIDVPDLLKDGVYKTVIVKNEGRSLKHGVWKWYDPQAGFITRTEEFIRDSSVNPLAMFGLSDKNRQPVRDTATAKKIPKPSVIQEWEKKNSGKKKVNVRDGATGY